MIVPQILKRPEKGIHFCEILVLLLSSSIVHFDANSFRIMCLVWTSSTCHICIITKVSNEQWSCHHQALSPNIRSMSYQTLWRPWANCFSIDKLDGICGVGLWKWKSWTCWSIAQRGLKLADVSLRWFLVGCGICCQYAIVDLEEKLPEFYCSVLIVWSYVCLDGGECYNFQVSILSLRSC